MKYYKIAGVLYGVLILTLIASKFVGAIHWAWGLVLLPLWLPVVLAIIIALLAIILFAGTSSGGRNPFQ